MTLDPSLAEQTPTAEEKPDVRLENEVYTNDRGGASSIDRLFVTDPTTGQEIRLGDDRGNAHRVAVSMSFIVWNFRCDCPDDGIHIYTFDDHQDTLFASRSDFYAITTEGVWIIYVKPGKGNVSNTMLAYNVETTEQLTMDEDASLYLCFAFCEDDNIAPHPDQVAPIRQITFNGTAFFWISNDQHIEQYDLTTRTHTAHPIPAYAWERPIDISASDKTVVWRSDAGYWGYDLLNQQLFAINANPPGWEDIGGVRLVSVMEDDQVRIYRNVDDQEFSFTAPIIRPPE
jgi:hypothetical protein